MSGARAVVPGADGASAVEAVETVGLTRTIGDRVVLDSIDLRIRSGEIFGLIGRNGAGKTTLIECITGMQAPTAGSIRVLGRDPRWARREFTARVAVQSQASALLPALTVLETLELFSSLYPSVRPISGLLADLGLAEVTRQRVGALSGGEARRLQIALALLPYAELVVLDEPSAAVDPHGRALIEASVRSLAREGVTVVLSTHDMGEAEQWCDRVAVLERGRLVALGRPADLIAEHRGRASVTFVVEATTDLDALRSAAGADGILVEREGDSVRVRIDTADVDALVRRLTFARGVRMRGLSIAQRGLAALYFDERESPRAS